MATPYSTDLFSVCIQSVQLTNLPKSSFAGLVFQVPRACLQQAKLRLDPFHTEGKGNLNSVKGGRKRLGGQDRKRVFGEELRSRQRENDESGPG